MSRPRIALAVGAVVVVAIVLFLFLRDDSDTDTVLVERGSIDVSIDTVGTVQLENPIPVRSAASGTVEAL
ncbi:MAG: hypothetical protein R3A46_20205, partial [Thermomicrobiales bacterium]